MNIYGLEFTSLWRFYKKCKIQIIDSYNSEHFSVPCLLTFKDNLYDPPREFLGTQVHTKSLQSFITEFKPEGYIIDSYNIWTQARDKAYKLAYNALKASIPHEMTKDGVNLFDYSLELLQKLIMNYRRDLGVETEDLVAVRIAPRTYAIVERRKHLIAMTQPIIEHRQAGYTYEMQYRLGIKAAFFKTSNNPISVVKIRKGL